MGYLKAAIARFFWALCFLAFFPVWAAAEKLQTWIVDSNRPHTHWMVRDAPQVDVASLPLYLGIVSVCALPGIVFTAVVLRSWGRRTPGKGSAAMKWLGVAAFITTAMTAVYVFLYSYQATALSVAASTASVLLLLSSLAITMVSRPEDFARRNVGAYLALCIAVGLVGGWAAGIIWAIIP